MIDWKLSFSSFVTLEWTQLCIRSYRAYIFQILILSRLISGKCSNYFRRSGVAEYAEQEL